MKRKVAKIGPATLMVSLPSKWTKQFDIKKGDEVDLEEKGPSLLLKTTKIKSKEVKEVDVTEMPKIFVVKSILSLYKQGYDEIEIVFKNKELKDHESNKRQKTSDVIEEAVADLIGFEIIEQKSNRIKIKNIATPSPKEFNNVLRRLFLLMISYMEESLEALKEQDDDAFVELIKRKRNFARFNYYSLRLLATGAASPEDNHLALYSMITHLYDIIDLLWYINVEQPRNGQVSKKAIEVYTSVLSTFKLIYELFYRFSKETAEKIYVQREKSLQEINKITNQKDISSAILCARLAIIFNTYYRITEAIIGMKVV